jgi:hypothetical protein
MDTSALISLRNIVNRARRLGRISEDRDPSLYLLAMDAMRELSLFSLPQKNSVKVTPDNLGRIAYPKDLLRFLSLSVPYNGRDLMFTRDKALVSTSTKTYSFESLDAEYGEGKTPNDNFSITYSKGNGSPVYFTTNERLRYCQVQGFTGTELTLNYISSGISESPEAVEIPRIYESAITAYILYRESEYDTTLPLGERKFREDKYYAELEDLNMINYAPSLDEIMDAYYKNLYQTVKRL